MPRDQPPVPNQISGAAFDFILLSAFTLIKCLSQKFLHVPDTYIPCWSGAISPGPRSFELGGLLEAKFFRFKLRFCMAQSSQWRAYFIFFFLSFLFILSTYLPTLVLGSYEDSFAPFTPYST